MLGCWLHKLHRQFMRPKHVTDAWLYAYVHKLIKQYWDFTIQPWKTYPIILIITFDQSESTPRFRKGAMTVTQTLKINIHEGQMRSIQSYPLTHNGALFSVLPMRNGPVSLHFVGKRSTKRKQNIQLRKNSQRRMPFKKIDKKREKNLMKHAVLFGINM